MLRGIIDIGSNSIKGFIYTESGDSFSSVWSHHCYTKMYSYIGESGLSDEGFEALVRDVSLLETLMTREGCPPQVFFATAGLRDSANRDDIMRRFRERTGHEIDLLSPMEEALCDMTSMRYFSGVNRALGMDMGGGSAQFFEYDGERLGRIMSLPIGALKIKEMFVKGDVPSAAEEEAIRSYVKDTLGQFGPYETDVICAMGGSIVETVKLADIHSFPFRVAFDVIEELKETLEGMEDVSGYLKSVCPGRETTILPAVISYLAIADHFGAKELVVLSNGVREGYYIRHMLGKGKEDE